MRNVFLFWYLRGCLGEDLMGKAVTKETTLRVQEPGHKLSKILGKMSSPSLMLPSCVFGRIVMQSRQLKICLKNMDTAIEIPGTGFWYSCHHFREKSKEILLWTGKSDARNIKVVYSGSTYTQSICSQKRMAASPSQQMLQVAMMVVIANESWHCNPIELPQVVQ